MDNLKVCTNFTIKKQKNKTKTKQKHHESKHLLRTATRSNLRPFFSLYCLERERVLDKPRYNAHPSLPPPKKRLLYLYPGGTH